jgi:hypothetical protein
MAYRCAPRRPDGNPISQTCARPRRGMVDASVLPQRLADLLADVIDRVERVKRLLEIVDTSPPRRSRRLRFRIASTLSPQDSDALDLDAPRSIQTGADQTPV